MTARRGCVVCGCHEPGDHHGSLDLFAADGPIDDFSICGLHGELFGSVGVDDDHAWAELDAEKMIGKVLILKIGAEKYEFSICTEACVVQP